MGSEYGPEPPELVLLGLSFRNAPPALRNALSFGRDDAAAVLRTVAAEQPSLEAATLSTCHRTEFYVAAPVCDSFGSVWPGRASAGCRTGR